MAFGEPLKDICQQKVSSHCLSKNGEATLIYNKSRMACKWCNEEIKTKQKAEKRERNAAIRESVGEMLQKVGVKPKASPKDDDVKFYKEAWKKNENWKGGCTCEECDRFLSAYSSVYVSHIISRGADTRMRHDHRNINILCYAHHQQWETGDRQSMRIYDKNQNTISILKAEYNYGNQG
jgi:hypothetical protein